MTAGLTVRKDGFVEMAYLASDGLPWHKLGNELTEDEACNIDDRALAKAGMDWLIKRSRVRYGSGDQMRIIDDQHVLFRSDTKDHLGIVGAGFKVVQPKDIMNSFQTLQKHGFKLSAAGTLFGGKRFWVTASIGDEVSILGADSVRGFLLGVTACDGSMKTQFKLTNVRGICNNTVTIALQGEGSSYKCSHRSVFDAEAMKDALGICRGSFASWVDAARKMSLITVNMKEAGELTAKLLIESKTVTKEDVTASTGYKTIQSLFDHGKGNHGETAWDWFNGVTDYVDHYQRAKTDSHRMSNSLFGKGDALKTMAFERALALTD